MSLADYLKWTTKNPLTAGKSNEAADFVDGMLYVFDGTGPSSTIEVYSTVTGAWRTDAATDLVARDNLASTVDSSGNIYLIDGLTGTGVTAEVTKFNPFNDTVVQVASNTTARQLATAAIASNGKIYLFGGENSSSTVLNTVEAYNTGNNTWSSAVATMPVALQGASAVASADGSVIYVIGGSTTTVASGASAALYRYNVSANTWSTLASMPTAVFGATAALVDGEIVVAGGENSSGTAVSTTQIYNPATDSWTTGASSMSTAEAFAGQGQVSSGSTLFAAGGTGSNTALQTASVTTPADAQIYFRIEAGNTGELQLGDINADDTGRHTIYWGGGNDSTAPPNATGISGETYIAIDPSAGLVFSAGLGDKNTSDAFSVHNLNTGALISTTEFGPDTGGVNDDVVQSLAINPFTQTLYVGDWDGALATTGIREFTYAPTTGALTPLATNNGFLVTAAQNPAITDAIAMYFDVANHKLYYVDDDGGYDFSPFPATNGVYVLDVNSPNTSTELTSNGSGVGQFPTADQKTAGTFEGANGNIVGLAVDVADGIVFFETTDVINSATNALWYVTTGGGANQTATKITLPITLHFAGQSSQGDSGNDSAGLSFDPVSKQLYLSDAVNSNTTSDLGHLYVLQWNNVSKTVSLVSSTDVETLDGSGSISPEAAISDTNIDNLPNLTTSGAATHAVERGANITLLTAAPTITDVDGNHLVSATVQITAGTFTVPGNDSSSSDDNLTINSADRTGTNTSGTINGTSISYSWSSSTETLTLSGYDTLADYQTALSFVQYFTTGHNPTDYGLNPARTITWQVNDGAVGNPSGTNTTTTTLNIDAVNDAPVASAPASYVEQEHVAFDLHNASLNVSDVDGGITGQNEVATLKVTEGTLHAIAGTGSSAGVGIAGNNSATLTITGTIAQINGLLNGDATSTLTHTGNIDANDTPNSITLSLSINDGGFTGSGGALTSSTVTSTITAPDDTTVTYTGLSSNTSGSPVQGSTITATVHDGGVDGVSGVTFTWKVAGIVVGDSSNTYTPTEADEGKILTVDVSFNDPNDNSIAETDTGIGVGSPNTVLDSADLVANLSSNSPAQGSLISVTSVTDALADVFSSSTFQWKVNTGAGFVNATGTGNATSTYTPTESDEGGQLEVVVTYAGDDGNSGNTETTTVVASNTVADSADLTATISSNSPVQGTKISVATATDGGTNVLATATYQWKVDTGGGFNNATGTGATTATYTPTEGDEGGTLEVIVSVTDPGAAGGTEKTTLVATSTIADSADLVGTLSTNSPVQASPISLTAVTDGGNDVHTTATYQWKVDTGSGFNNATGTGATTATYSPTEGDEGGTLEVVITYADQQGTETATVVATNTIADSTDLTATISNNSPAQGTALSVNAASDGGTDVLGTASYQWKVNTGGGFVNATGTGATTATYTPAEADEGGKLEVVVSFTDGGTNESTTVVATGTVAETATADLSATLSTNSPVQAAKISVATATDGGTDVLGTASYQWKVNTGGGFNNATGTGATTATYTPTEGDEGGTLEVIVSVTEPGGLGTETTTVSATSTIADSADLAGTLSTSSPAQASAISLTAVTDNGTDVKSTATYQWKVDTGSGFNNATGTGATTATYTPTEGDEGGTLEVVITYADQGGTETATVVATNTIADTSDLTATISNNSPVQGTALSVATASDGGNDVLATASYQWKVNTGGGFVNATGTGATTATYTPAEGDEGGKLEVVVSITDPGNPGFTESTTVTVTNTVAEIPDLTATLSTNSPVQASQISVASASESGTDVLGTATYQWKVNTGAGFVNATGTGATTATYTPTEGDEGGTLEVVVTLANDPGNPGNTETTTVTAATAIADSADLVGTLSTNSPAQGSAISLTAVTDNGTDVHSTATYQWKVNTGSGFNNATGTGTTTATYTPTEGDEGGTLEVVITYADQGGTETATVVASNAIADSPDLTVFTSGLISPVQGTPISVTTATDGGTNVLGTAAYQWKVNTGAGFVNATGTGATTATYTPTEGDEGGTLEVIVSVTDGGNPGNTESITLAAANAVADSADLLATLSSNSPVQGSQISVATATDGGNNVLGTAAYHWRVNTGGGFVNATGTGALTATYTPTEGDEGGTLEVLVSVGDNGNPLNIETTTVVATNTIADSADLTATLSSATPTEGTQISVATASDGGNNVLGAASYQWKVNTGAGFVNATGTGATTATYTPTEGDEGGTLEVLVSVTDPGNPGSTETTTVVAGTVHENATENATISFAGLTAGNAVEGTTVTATVTDPDAPASGINYTWKVNGTTVSTGTDAAGKTYTPTEANEGLPITVSVSFTDTHGNAESGTASAGTVQESPTENASFTVTGFIAGHAVPNHPLTATVTEPDAPNAGITYTWIVNGVTKQSGSSNTYTPQPGDAAKPLTVTVSFTDTHGFAETGTQSFGNVGSTSHYDFNGDSISDLAFQLEAFNAGGAKGTPTLWLWNGTGPTTQTTFANPGASWNIVASADVNGDGDADLIWQNLNGQPGIWLMNGTTPIAVAGLTNPGANWHLIASGDFNGDGMSDLLWKESGGLFGVWLMNGTTPIAEAGVVNHGPTWTPVGTADFNGDGRDDILSQDSTTGNLMIDIMNGTTVSSSVSISGGGSSWHAVSTGVFNGVPEIAWQNNDGTVGLWLMNGTTPAVATSLSNPGPAWKLVSMDHFTPNGNADLLFQNVDGTMGMWQLNGTHVVGTFAFASPGAGNLSVNGNAAVDPPGVGVGASVAGTTSVTGTTSTTSTATAASTTSNGTMRTSTPDLSSAVAAPTLLTTPDPTLTQHQPFTGG